MITTASRATTTHAGDNGARPPRPTALEPIPENYPDSMKAEARWCVWRYDFDQARGKWAKVPYRIDGGGRAASNDPSSFGTFKDAIRAYKRSGDYAGFGFRLGDGITGVDLDHCLNDEGRFVWGDDICASFDTFTEISPSGDGVKIYCRGCKPAGVGCSRKGMGPDGRGNVESWDSGRWFAVTGHLIEGKPTELRDCSEPLAALCQKYLMPQSPGAKHNGQKAVNGDDAFRRCLGRMLAVGTTDNADGSRRLLTAACRVVEFDLSDSDGLRCIWEYSRFKPFPANWTDEQIIRRIRDAEKRTSRGKAFAGNGAKRLPKPTPPNGGTDQACPNDAESDEDRATELANAEELHRQHGRELHFHVDRGGFYVWTGKLWQRDSDGQVERWAKTVAKGSAARLCQSVDGRELARFTKMVESARGIAGVIRLLQSEPGISLAAEAFDCDDYLLNVDNGTIDLRSGQLRSHDPADLITHCLSTPYDPAAKCPLWESVVHRSMDGNESLIGYLRRWAGLFLTGSPNTHELLIAYGTGANGKSVIFDTLCGILEALATVAPESLLVARHGQNEHPTEIADLLGRRLVVASETESGATLRLQLVKRLTGDARLKGRFMRQDLFEFRRTHKMVLITNNRPRLPENTEAVWRRLRLLPFNVVIPPAERDPNLLDKLKLEYPGILAWCVRGRLEQQATGMNPPDEVMVATNEYRADADELAEFITEFCIVDPRVDEDGDHLFRVVRTELYAAYVIWAKRSNDRNALDRKEFYEAIRHREGIVEGEWKAAGKSQRGFKGIGLTAPIKDESP